MSIQTMRTWKIGDVEITRIVEVNNWEDDITMLLPDATPQPCSRIPGCSRTMRRRKAR